MFQVEDWIFQLMVTMKIVVHNTLEPYVVRCGFYILVLLVVVLFIPTVARLSQFTTNIFYSIAPCFRLLQSKIDTYREEHHVVDLIQTFRDLIFFNEDEPR